MGLWVSPVVLVSGVGLLILSTSARYSQMHSELRELMQEARNGDLAAEPVQVLFDHLQSRTKLLLSALLSLYLSVGFLITGSLVGALSALWKMSHTPVVVLTSAGIFGIAFASLQLIRESRIFLSTVNTCTHGVTGSPGDAGRPTA
jgi:hypothetical protein